MTRALILSRPGMVEGFSSDGENTRVQTSRTVPSGRPGTARRLLVLQAGDGVVGITDNDHVARGAPLPPRLDPEVVDIVEVDVAQERRLMICALWPRKANRWPENGSFFSVS